MQCKVYVVSDDFGSTFRVVENAAVVKCHFKDLKGSMKPSAKLVGFQRIHRSLIRIDEETSGDAQGVPLLLTWRSVPFGSPSHGHVLGEHG